MEKQSMDVTLAFDGADALEGFNEVKRKYRADGGNVTIGGLAQTALGAISKAVQDGLRGIDSLPTDIVKNADTKEAKRRLDRAVRVWFLHVDPNGLWFDGLATVISRTTNGDYLIALPDPYQPGGRLMVLANETRVKDREPAWSVFGSWVSGPQTA
jgi:hypothetical protein